MLKYRMKFWWSERKGKGSKVKVTEHDEKTSKSSGVFRLPASFSLKNIIVTALVVLGGGGGIAGARALGYCTADDIKDAVGAVVEKEDKRHEVIDEKFEEQGSQIEKVQEVVDSVQTTQIREIARREARRITVDIRDREKREQVYDRILDKNIRRLEHGDDPCPDIVCSGTKR